MASTGTQAADFIKILHPTIQAAGLSTQIACCDSEGWQNQVSMLNSIKSAGAESMLKAVTSHTYTSGPSGPMNTKVNVWMSEQGDNNGGWTTAWYSGGGAGEVGGFQIGEFSVKNYASQQTTGEELATAATLRELGLSGMAFSGVC